MKTQILIVCCQCWQQYPQYEKVGEWKFTIMGDWLKRWKCQYCLSRDFQFVVETKKIKDD